MSGLPSRVREKREITAVVEGEWLEEQFEVVVLQVVIGVFEKRTEEAQ